MGFKPSHGTIDFKIEDGIAYLTLNRVAASNAINPEMQVDLAECWPEINNDLSVRAVIITGNGKDFSNGIDEAEFSQDKAMADLVSAYAHKNFPDLWKSGVGPVTEHPAYLKLGLPDRARGRPAKPLIVAVNGKCAGLALRFVATADIVICSDDAEFFDPRVNASLTPAEETLALVRLKSAPREVALRMAIMGERYKVDAKRAFETGMVTEIVPKAKLLGRAVEIAGYIKEASPAATRAVVGGFWDVFTTAPYTKQLWYGQIFSQQARKMDGQEGVLSWVENRAPVWPSATTWSPPWEPVRITFKGRSADVSVDVKSLRQPGTPG